MLVIKGVLILFYLSFQIINDANNENNESGCWNGKEEFLVKKQLKSSFFLHRLFYCSISSYFYILNNSTVLQLKSFHVKLCFLIFYFTLLFYMVCITLNKYIKLLFFHSKLFKLFLVYFIWSTSRLLVGLHFPWAVAARMTRRDVTCQHGRRRLQRRFQQPAASPPGKRL